MVLLKSSSIGPSQSRRNQRERERERERERATKRNIRTQFIDRFEWYIYRKKIKLYYFFKNNLYEKENKIIF
jgi:hypothetical protein